MRLFELASEVACMLRLVSQCIAAGLRALWSAGAKWLYKRGSRPSARWPVGPFRRLASGYVNYGGRASVGA